MQAPNIVPFHDFEQQAAALMTPPPIPYVSPFKVVPAHELFLPGPDHEHLIDDMLVRGEMSMLAGASQSGKSFLALAMAMAVARGVPFFNRMTRQGLVLYVAGEGACGLWRRRIPAYWSKHELTEGAHLPFVLVPRRIDLHASDDDVVALIVEAIHQAKIFAPTPLELIIIDTLSAAMIGANENSSQDVSRILARCARLSEETGAAILLVHHLNAGGEKVRGHTSLLANLDSVLLVNKLSQTDLQGRPLRRLLLAKEKESESGTHMDFVLEPMSLGLDESGKPKSSCVVVPPAGYDDVELAAATKGNRLNLPDVGRTVLKSLDLALEKHGVVPPTDLGVPSSIKRVVRGALWRAEFQALAVDPDDAKGIDATMRRWGYALFVKRVIGRRNPWVWRTGQIVAGEREHVALPIVCPQEMETISDEIML